MFACLDHAAGFSYLPHVLFDMSGGLANFRPTSTSQATPEYVNGTSVFGADVIENVSLNMLFAIAPHGAINLPLVVLLSNGLKGGFTVDKR